MSSGCHGDAPRPSINDDSRDAEARDRRLGFKGIADSIAGTQQGRERRKTGAPMDERLLQSAARPELHLSSPRRPSSARSFARSSRLPNFLATRVNAAINQHWAVALARDALMIQCKYDARTAPPRDLR
ncbi:hypothetical protein Aduo_008322 [Ancylostoma duodenale]